MEFLPLQKYGRPVHAGFVKRFIASFVDAIVIIPFGFALAYLGDFSVYMAMLSTALSVLFYSAYSIVFHARYGATLGKMVAGIKVTLPDGRAIGLRTAFIRSSVDLVFAVKLAATQIWALSKVDPQAYGDVGWAEKAIMSSAFLPVWISWISIANNLWVWGEVISLLFNERKRALHDLIAGTVVIDKRFARAD